MTTLKESDSLKSTFMRSIALNAGASVGIRETECCFSTCSSDGTPTVAMTPTANHARMMGTESRRIVRATNGCVLRWLPVRPWLPRCGAATVAIAGSTTASNPPPVAHQAPCQPQTSQRYLECRKHRRAACGDHPERAATRGPLPGLAE